MKIIGTINGLFERVCKYPLEAGPLLLIFSHYPRIYSFLFRITPYIDMIIKLINDVNFLVSSISWHFVPDRRKLNLD